MQTKADAHSGICARPQISTVRVSVEEVCLPRFYLKMFEVPRT